MRIPDHTIDDIRAASDIVSVVSEHVRLRNRGSNHIGLCPFHEEKTPSFNVSPSRGIFKCFGCGKGGNVFQFVMEVEALSFVEAVRKLASRAGIAIPQSGQDRERASEYDTLFGALRFAEEFFRFQLKNTQDGHDASRYLQDRGLLPETVERFGLGYAPPRWDALIQEAARQHIAPEVLERAGLVIPRKGGGHYDRFRGRVMFPIYSPVGKVLGFGGRLHQAEPDSPKYINSPETKVYSKSRVLYGLYQGKVATQTSEEAILVEGYTDVIALHQAGVEHVVATCGTALTAPQVQTIGRYAKRMVLLFDADEAGANAAQRSVNLVLAGGMSAYAISLPQGHDPDSFVKERGGSAFQAFAREHRQDFVEFIMTTAHLSGGQSSPEGQAAAMRNVIAALRCIPDPLLQESYVRRAIDLLRIPEEQLRRALAGRAPSKAPEAVQATVVIPAEERILLRLMVDGGTTIVRHVHSHVSLPEFSEGPARDLAAAMFELRERSTEEIRHRISEVTEEPVRRLAIDMQMDRYAPSPNWAAKKIKVPGLNENPLQVANDAIIRLKKNRIGKELSKLQRILYETPADEQGPLLEELKRLQEVHVQILNGDFLR